MMINAIELTPRYKELRAIAKEKNVHKLTPQERAIFFQIEKAVNETEECYFHFHRLESKKNKAEIKREIAWQILRFYFYSLEDIGDLTIPLIVKGRLTARVLYPRTWMHD